MSNHRLLDALLDLDEAARLRALRQLSEEERRELRYHWKLWARERQLPPPGDWTTWLILAGRGFGKTRAGAEWVRGVCQARPEARFALVGASLAEVRAVMVEGESGILAACPPGQVPVFEPSLRRLTWGNGAQATLYSAGEPESLRGPQHSHACRPDPEGRLRQRDCREDRCPAVPCGRGRSRHAASHPRRRPKLADREDANRWLGRTRGTDCLAPRWKLALHRPDCWHAPVQQGPGPGHALGQWLDRGQPANPSQRRNHRRCRVTTGHRRDNRGFGESGNRLQELKAIEAKRPIT